MNIREGRFTDSLRWAIKMVQERRAAGEHPETPEQLDLMEKTFDDMLYDELYSSRARMLRGDDKYPDPDYKNRLKDFMAQINPKPTEEVLEQLRLKNIQIREQEMLRNGESGQVSTVGAGEGEVAGTVEEIEEDAGIRQQ